MEEFLERLVLHATGEMIVYLYYFGLILPLFTVSGFTRVVNGGSMSKSIRLFRLHCILMLHYG